MCYEISKLSLKLIIISLYSKNNLFLFKTIDYAALLFSLHHNHQIHTGLSIDLSINVEIHQEWFQTPYYQLNIILL